MKNLLSGRKPTASHAFVDSGQELSLKERTVVGFLFQELFFEHRKNNKGSAAVCPSTIVKGSISDLEMSSELG